VKEPDQRRGKKGCRGRHAILVEEGREKDTSIARRWPTTKKEGHGRGLGLALQRAEKKPLKLLFRDRTAAGRRKTYRAE